jgi:hypothetical protein
MAEKSSVTATTPHRLLSMDKVRRKLPVIAAGAMIIALHTKATTNQAQVFFNSGECQIFLFQHIRLAINGSTIELQKGVCSQISVET